jgi:hypothetical protein
VWKRPSSIELFWRIDPDGSLGIRRLSATTRARKSALEYFRWMFENTVPDCRSSAAQA